MPPLCEKMPLEVCIVDMAFEEKIARAYIEKSKRSRFIFERKKDPNGAVMSLDTRFPFMEHLKFDYTTQYKSPRHIRQTLGIEERDHVCYILASYTDMDGQYLPFARIMPEALQNGHGALIVYPPTGIAYFIGDAWCSYQPNYYLNPSIPLNKP